ncbi:MAG: shikimate dehydrogenase [Bacteroidetes bacterium]|nr:shikimate dehydrogenase [Bacteroidota bacterium]
MITYGLIGYPLSHSFSEAFFTEKFELNRITGNQYRLFPMADLKDLPLLLRQNPGLRGLNVTLPYKEQILGFLDDIDEETKKIGAVNTIRIDRHGDHYFMKGYNTDYPAFLQSADFSKHTSALILGNGGAAKAVAHALRNLKISYLIVSRTPVNESTISYKDLTEQLIRQHTLIINATPAGMFPATDQFPLIPYSFLTPAHFLYDLVYHPIRSQFLIKGFASGTKIQNGLLMFLYQAELSYKIWTG